MKEENARTYTGKEFWGFLNVRATEQTPRIEQRTNTEREREKQTGRETERERRGGKKREREKNVHIF